MKNLLILLFLLTASVFAQKPTVYKTVIDTVVLYADSTATFNVATWIKNPKLLKRNYNSTGVGSLKLEVLEDVGVTAGTLNFAYKRADDAFVVEDMDSITVVDSWVPKYVSGKSFKQVLLSNVLTYSYQVTVIRTGGTGTLKILPIYQYVYWD